MNRHTGEKCSTVSIPTGWEGVYEQVKINSDVPENIIEEKSILDRVSEIETIINKIKKILPIETGDNK